MFFTPGFRRSGIYHILFLNSLSIRDITFLAQSSDDGAETIKQFYEWKHKSLSFAIKSILTFLLGNFALVIKLFFGRGEANEVSSLFGQDIYLQYALIAVSGLIILIEFFMIIKIRDIPQEYVDAVTIYNALR